MVTNQPGFILDPLMSRAMAEAIEIQKQWIIIGWSAHRVLADYQELTIIIPRQEGVNAGRRSLS
jgi:hypothetical protein